MGLHKLAAGSGYTYLTRQVASGDDTNRGYSSLGAYYEQTQAMISAPTSHNGRWHNWATAVAARMTTDPAWPQTAAGLDAAERAGLTPLP